MLQLKATSPYLKWQLSGSFNLEAVKPDTVRMIVIKEELEHTALPSILIGMVGH